MDCLPQIHTIAIHAEPGYRSVVPGVGVLCSENNDIMGAGLYQNSIGRQSEYIFAGKYLTKYKSAKFGIIGGVVTGYQESKVSPLGGLVASVPTYFGAVHFIGAPKVKYLTPAFVQISFTFDIK